MEEWKDINRRRATDSAAPGTITHPTENLVLRKLLERNVKESDRHPGESAAKDYLPCQKTASRAYRRPGKRMPVLKSVRSSSTHRICNFQIDRLEDSAVLLVETNACSVFVASAFVGLAVSLEDRAVRGRLDPVGAAV